MQNIWQLAASQVLGHLGGSAAGGDVKLVAKRDAADAGAVDAVPLAGECWHDHKTVTYPCRQRSPARAAVQRAPRLVACGRSPSSNALCPDPAADV